IRYFSAAPNFFDRIGHFMVEWQDKPFWWLSLSGKEKVLVWVPWTGCAMSHVMKVGFEWAKAYQDRLDAVTFPYAVSSIRWACHAGGDYGSDLRAGLLSTSSFPRSVEKYSPLL